MRYYEADNVIYPGHTAMTWGDVRRSDALNRKNHYGMSYDELRRLCARHKRARAAGDIRTMEKIEYRLTDINFHHECSLLHAGEYDTFNKEMEA